jgi:hypothetical protein
MNGDGSSASDLITCDGCGKKYKWKLELAGRRLKCPCGAAIVVPDRAAVLEPVYDLFEGEAQDAPPIYRPAPEEPPVGAGAKSAARARGGAAPAARKAANPDAAAIAERLGIALPARKRLDHTADVLAGRAELDQLAEGTLVRNVIVPVPIIFAGMILSFVQVRFWQTDGATSANDAGALGVMVTRAVFSVVLMLVTMFLLTTLADVNFLGGFKKCMLRLCAIAIGPSAVYASLTFLIGGDMGGPFAGAMASIALYGILFWALMRLDAKDTAVCTILTFSLVMLANYFAFRFAGILHGSDI